MMMQQVCNVLLTLPEESLKVGHAAADEFVRIDPYGIGMTIIAMSIVFSVLAIVFLFFSNVSKLYIALQNWTVKKQDLNKVSNNIPESIDAEVTAAIGMAIYQYYTKQHDMESLKITIQKVSKLYSPWSSKLYMMNKPPR